LFKGPLVLKLGLTSVPDNLLLQRGRVIARGLSTDDLIARIEKMI
jgi:antioxidant, ahpC/TSA family